MTPARPLKDVFADLLGDDGAARPDADALLAASGHADLPVDLVAEAVVNYADTAPVEVAEHLSPYVMAHSGVPAPDADVAEHSYVETDWADLFATAPSLDPDVEPDEAPADGDAAGDGDLYAAAPDGPGLDGDEWDEIDDDGSDLDGDGRADDAAVIHFGDGAETVTGLLADDLDDDLDDRSVLHFDGDHGADVDLDGQSDGVDVGLGGAIGTDPPDLDGDAVRHAFDDGQHLSVYDGSHDGVVDGSDDGDDGDDGDDPGDGLDG